jgi:hypothetical protein
MSKYIVLVSLFFMIACSNNADVARLKADVDILKAQNDSLQKQVEAIKPGLGELMLTIQMHHNKLWFAGKANNWPLAQFEYDETLEIVKQAEEIETDRKEVKLFPTMIYPQLDSLQNAIKLKDSKKFEGTFVALTNACNGCHKEVHFEFNSIKIPDQPPFSNQDFSPNK